jgi:alpha-glucosidase
MRPILNKRALFSDTTSSFVTPAEPEAGETISIRFRTGKNNVDLVNLMVKGEALTMKKCNSDDYFDFYECELTMPEETLEYYFEVKVGKICFFYNARGITKELQDYYMFRIIPGFHTPKWAKGAVMYQIYVDRFYNGDPTNDVESHEYLYLGDYSEKVTDWNKYPAQMGVREFYGGDLQGVLDKMDYLEDLGIDVIYFNPLFVSPSNHKYDIQDYDYIDPHFTVIPYDEGEVLHEGDLDNTHATRYINRVTDIRNLEASNEFFAALVAEIHRRGMKVILDGVFNHCGSYNKWLDRQKIYTEERGYAPGAYISAESPYRDFFKFYSENWPDNGDYDGWWGHDTLPKLNYEGSKVLEDYIIGIGRKWVSPPFNADGWRLDVAADLGFSEEYNHKFWKRFRAEVKDANPNAIILAENYESSWKWLQGGEWDTIMNYEAFMEPVTWFLTGLEKHSDQFRGDLLNNHEAFFGAMLYHMSRMNTQSLQVAMNELSNHDHSRFLTRTNGRCGRLATAGSAAASEGIKPAVMREAVLIQMTWPGAPTIYYGDEAGLTGWTDPDSRRTYPWGHEDKDLLRFHKELIGLHRSYDTLKTGSLKFLAGRHGIISYGRFDSEHRFVIAINNNDTQETIEIPVWELGTLDTRAMVRLVETSDEGYNFEAVIYRSEHGVIVLRLKPHSGICIKNLPDYLL